MATFRLEAEDRNTSSAVTVFSGNAGTMPALLEGPIFGPSRPQDV